MSLSQCKTTARMKDQSAIQTNPRGITSMFTKNPCKLRPKIKPSELSIANQKKSLVPIYQINKSERFWSLRELLKWCTAVSWREVLENQRATANQSTAWVDSKVQLNPWRSLQRSFNFFRPVNLTAKQRCLHFAFFAILSTTKIIHQHLKACWKENSSDKRNEVCFLSLCNFRYIISRKCFETKRSKHVFHFYTVIFYKIRYNLF